MKIPFSPPDITDAEVEQVAEALRSGWITTGPKTKELEREVADFCGVNRAVCLNSQTACAEMTLRVLGVAKKIIVSDKVIYNYRVLEQSMSHGFNEKQVEDITKVYMILKQYLQNVEWDTENCLEIANLEYTIKMSSLLRDLWDSNLDMKYKKNTSSKIVNINNGMINSTTIIIQNRILWELCKKKCWILSLIYCRLLKVLSKRRRSSSENRLFEKKNSV